MVRSFLSSGQAGSGGLGLAWSRGAQGSGLLAHPPGLTPYAPYSPTLRDPKATPVDGAARLGTEQRRRKLLWAEAMKRGLGLDVLTCEHCGGRREVLTFITDPVVITKILDYLGLPSDLPRISAARPPPGSERLFDL